MRLILFFLYFSLSLGPLFAGPYQSEISILLSLYSILKSQGLNVKKGTYFMFLEASKLRSKFMLKFHLVL